MSAPSTICIAKRPVLILAPDCPKMVFCLSVFVIKVLVPVAGAAGRAFLDRIAGRRLCTGFCLVNEALDTYVSVRTMLPVTSRVYDPGFFGFNDAFTTCPVAKFSRASILMCTGEFLCCFIACLLAKGFLHTSQLNMTR